MKRVAAEASSGSTWWVENSPNIMSFICWTLSGCFAATLMSCVQSWLRS